MERVYFLPFVMLRKQWQTVVLKLIRKGVSEKEKKGIQKRLQATLTNNGEGFYVHAPKQRGHVKEQLRYIGRYIRRPDIGINRIEAYDGQNVTFKYIGKTDRKEKSETVSVEEFISSLIRHIPDEQFKTIRHYGMYSRQTKKMAKKLLYAWQQSVKRWIVKMRKTLRAQTWREPGRMPSFSYPREVNKDALKHSAASIIVAYNHPSGDHTPSRQRY